jgi:hypothetical protein
VIGVCGCGAIAMARAQGARGVKRLAEGRVCFFLLQRRAATFRAARVCQRSPRSQRLSALRKELILIAGRISRLKFKAHAQASLCARRDLL